MQTSEPIPGEPWPHDMRIEVQDSLQTLLDLLWVREAWGLTPVGADLPPLLTETPATLGPAAAPPASPAEWSAAWPAIWSAAVVHAADIRDPTLFAAAFEASEDSAERAIVLSRLLGPSWREEFGDAAFTDAHGAWSTAGFERRSRRPQLSLEEHPERLALDALLPAWNSGLAKVVTIPCRGDHTRIIGPRTLLVTDETRADPHRYRRALTRFAASPHP